MNERGSLLIVDDEPVITRLLSTIFIKENYRVQSAASGEEALALLDGDGIDLMITDILMPGMSGIELIEQIKQRKPDIQSMVITGHGDIEIAVEAMKLGAINFILKPINVEELKVSVEQGMQKVGLIKQIQAKQQELKDMNLELEDKVEKRTQELMESNEQLNLLAGVFSNSNESIFISNSAGQIIKINPAFSLSHGYSSEGVADINIKSLLLDKNGNEMSSILLDQLKKYGKWQGEIWLRHKNGDASPFWLGLSSSRLNDNAPLNYIGIAHDIRIQIRKERKIRHQAEHDPLTSLPNRRLFTSYFDEVLNQAAGHDPKITLLFLDLDRFKPVNDQFGHNVGDEVLKIVANRLQKILRGEDMVARFRGMVARFGGDEFVIMLNGVNEPHVITKVVKRVSEAIAKSITVQDYIISIGRAILPDNGASLDELLEWSDSVMYQEKQQKLSGINETRR
jgi:diguanylate cyclase (GGDEF)-like protein/PAS domain S-box-containing protein